MNKPDNNKLPLPKRYTAIPTTGEVLYEYICASEKLRAAATLNIFDAWLQERAKSARRIADRLRTDGTTEEAAAADIVENESVKNAFIFRDLMRLLGLPLPIQFLKENHCPLFGGSSYIGGYFLPSLSACKRFDEMGTLAKIFCEACFRIERTDVTDPDDDLKELKASWGDATAKESDLRKAFRDALKRRKAALQAKTGGRGRAGAGLLPPSSALNDLWHYLIVRGVAEHTGQSLDDLIAPDAKRAKKQAETLAGMIADTFDAKSIDQAALDSVKEQEGYSVKLNGYRESTGDQTGHGGKLDTKPIKEGARKAHDTIRAFEAECTIPDAAMEEAKKIQKHFAKLYGLHDDEEERYGVQGTQTTTPEESERAMNELLSGLQADAQARASNKVLMPRIPKKPSGQ